MSGAQDVAVGVALVVFAAALVRDVRVPMLGLVDLGFHELGHLLTYPLPACSRRWRGRSSRRRALRPRRLLLSAGTTERARRSASGGPATSPRTQRATSPTHRTSDLRSSGTATTTGRSRWSELDLIERAGVDRDAVRASGVARCVVGAAVLIVTKLRAVDEACRRRRSRIAAVLARSLVISSARRAHAYCVPRTARPASTTRIPGPGRTRSTSPSATSVKPTIVTTIRFALAPTQAT